MTDALYREDAYARECPARVVAVSERGVVLDRTVFYPTGGGQPGDSGVLIAGGAETAIVNTLKGESPGEIAHVLEEGASPPAVGAEATLRLDWDRRLRHMRMHTALHLLSVVIPLPVTGGSIGAVKSRLDFAMPEPPDDKQAIENQLNALITANHPLSEEWITDAELEANSGLVKTMSVTPPTGQGRVRLIRIGGGATPIDLQPCGGTHVRATAEIGPVALGKIENKGRQNRRVSITLVE